MVIIDESELKSGTLPINKIIRGNALKVLKKLPSDSIDCVITSPPYYAKRIYNEETFDIYDGKENCEHEWIKPNEFNPSLICKKCNAVYTQLGLEPSPEQYIKHLIQIFKEIKRVLKPSGNVFVVIDDTYAGSGFGERRDDKIHKARSGRIHHKMFNVNASRKSLMLVPEMFAMKMVYELGFILREKIIWSKKILLYKEGKLIGSTTPESVKDRNTHAFEFVYHFTIEPKYYFKQLKIQGANATDVVQISPEHSDLGHLAPFPTKLVEYLIEIGCPENGIVLDPFLGSGTTALVSLKKGRKFIGIEISKEYCEMAYKRISTYIKQKSIIEYISK